MKQKETLKININMTSDKEDQIRKVQQFSLIF